MIEKKIRVLRDIELNTYHGYYSLVEDEVRRVLFKNQNTFDDYLETGNFVEAGVDEKEIRPIPVILPEVDENTLVEVDNTVVEEEPLVPFTAAIEDLRRDESPQEGMEEVVKEPVSAEILEDLNQADTPTEEDIDYRDTTEPRPTDTPDVPDVPDVPQEILSELEETSEAPLEEIVPEVEEIPIAEQDESKPKLSPDDAPWQEGTPEFEGKVEETGEEHPQI